MTTDNVMMRVADDKMRADDAVKPYGRVSQIANPIVRGVQC